MNIDSKLIVWYHPEYDQLMPLPTYSQYSIKGMIRQGFIRIGVL